MASESVDGAGGTLLAGHQISNKCSVQCVAKMCGCGKVYIPLSDSEDLYKGINMHKLINLLLLILVLAN